MISAEERDAFYRPLVVDEAECGEPELLMFPELLRRGGTAVDVGANQGVFAYVLSGLADKVHAFEANPDYADIARRMLGDCASVHAVALSDARGRASFYVPYDHDGSVLHLAGNLKNSHSQFPRQNVIEVAVETLDSYDLKNVACVKVDVEGSELEVLAGGRTTILRDKPVLVLELLSGTYKDPLDVMRQVCDIYGYDGFVVHEGRRLPARETIISLNSNSTWGSKYITRNVLFLPRGWSTPSGN